jgi:hypothetical protein
MPSCRLKSRSDAEEHRFVKRACNEVDPDRQVGCYGANQARAAIRITDSIPYLRRESGRYGDRGETLLPD